MKLQLNETIVRIIGTANIPEDLGELQDDVALKLTGTIMGINPKPNFDGTYNKTFVVKIITVEQTK
jgi:hypothetical protein